MDPSIRLLKIALGIAGVAGVQYVKAREEDYRMQQRASQRSVIHASAGDRYAPESYNEREEAINTPFCRLQEKFMSFVLRGLINVSEAP